MDEATEPEKFNFFLELSKPQVYESLVLSRSLTLALALLYEREQSANSSDSSDGTSSFTEEDIRGCLRQVLPTDQREQREKYNQIIRQLQIHFLWRDEEKGIYQLKGYARDFCRLMYDRLEKKFQPTYAKRIFNSLIESLESVLRKVDDDHECFNHWVDYSFEQSRTELENQVEVLYNKVDETVRRLRDEVRPDAGNLLLTLQQAEQNLEDLTTDANELEYISHASEVIRGRLNQLQHKTYAEAFGNRVSKVSIFLLDTTEHLYLIRQRIRRIRPHIQRLFNVRQREFDLNTGKFLEYLLRNSKVVQHNGAKMLEFPSRIPEKLFLENRLVFTRLNKQTFIAPKPIRVERPIMSKEIRQKQEQEHEQRLERERQIQFWLEDVQSTLELTGEVMFSDTFFKILDSQEDGTAMALDVAQRLIRHYTLSPRIQIKIGPIVRKSSYPHHTIREMTITL